MSISYRIDAENRTIFWRLEEVVTNEEILTWVEQLYADPGFHAEYGRLVDATAVTQAPLRTDVIRVIAQKVARMGAGKIALVGSSDLMFGLLRMYEVWLGDVTCRVFRERKEALEWLGVRHQSSSFGLSA